MLDLVTRLVLLVLIIGRVISYVSYGSIEKFMVKVITTTGEVLIGVDWVIVALLRILHSNVWGNKISRNF